MKLPKADKDMFTEDFNKMLKIVPLNSLGFFFIGFGTLAQNIHRWLNL